MCSGNYKKHSVAVSVHKREVPWRRKSITHFFFLYFFMFIVLAGVYYTVLSSGYIELPINDLLASLSDYCRTERVEEDGLGLHPGENVTTLPPATFGVGVWVDESSMLPMVHNILKRIDKRMVEASPSHGELSETMKQKRYIYSFVHLQANTREKNMLVDFKTSDSGVFQTRSDAIKVLSKHARSQQMGLPTFKHVFNPDLSKEMQMIALSIFSLPSKLFGFVQDPQANPIWCHSLDVFQSFCVVLVDTQDQSRVDSNSVSDDMQRHVGLMEKHITAGIASVLAASLSIDSFRPNDIKVWHQLRNQAGCFHAMRSLRALRDSIRDRVDMYSHIKLRGLFTRLQQLVERREFVLAARAADDLQFHPLHAPDQFYPLDYVLTCHIVILLPLFLMTFINARFVADTYHRKRRKNL
ncbi:unnamed protein product [Phytomonas sp. EM1]|nr:unnamed protein product [Phytomonas sp. EM1]|eukprot:CCW60389.1 unnamed protein product [Phytomonas sp. isolate EM1]